MKKNGRHFNGRHGNAEKKSNCFLESIRQLIIKSCEGVFGIVHAEERTETRANECGNSAVIG